MGRSVWVASGAADTVFFPFHVGYCPACEFVTSSDGFECEECGTDLEPCVNAQAEWDFLVESIQYAFTEHFPSVTVCDWWPERESRAIAENGFFYVAISEYCGLVSLSVVPQEPCYDYDYPNFNGLAESWSQRYAVPFLQRWSQLHKLGTFSNGEAVYQAIK